MKAKTQPITRCSDDCVAVGWKALRERTPNELLLDRTSTGRAIYGQAPTGHSVRSAAIGSMHAARQAGIMDATRDTRPSRNVALVSMTGSHGCTPNS